MTNKIIKILILMAAGLVYPLSYVVIGFDSGKISQAHFLECKTTIDLVVALMVLGLDKAYIHFHSKGGDKSLSILISILIAFIFFAVSLAMIPWYGISILVIASGCLSGVFFSVSRAIVLIKGGMEELIQITLAYFLISISMLMMLPFGVDVFLIFSGCAWSFYSFKKISEKFDYCIFSKDWSQGLTLRRDVRFGLVELLIGFSSVLFAFISIQIFKGIDQDGEVTVMLGGFFIALSILKYPVQMLMPIIMRANHKSIKIKQNYIQHAIISVVLFLIILEMINYFYKILPVMIGLSSIYLVVSLISYLIQIIIYKKSKINSLYFGNLLSVIMIVIVYSGFGKLVTMTDVNDFLLFGIFFESIRLTACLVKK